VPARIGNQLQIQPQGGRYQQLSEVGLNQFVLVLVLVLAIGCFRFPPFRCHRTECFPRKTLESSCGRCAAWYQMISILK